MKVGEAIYALLSGESDVTDIVSTNIFPVVAPEKSSVPYIVYNLISETPTNTKGDGATYSQDATRSPLDTDRVQVSGFTDTYAEAVDIAVAIRVALDRATYSSANLEVDNIVYLDTVDDYEKKADDKGVFAKHSDYTVRIRNDSLI
jgi:hypothetical protein